MELIYEKGLDLINTSESFYKGYFIKGGNMLIPYINLCLMQGHPLNKKDKVVNLNYGFLVLSGVVLIKKNKEWVYDDTSFKYGRYEFLDVGGTDINVGHDVELKILFEQGYLQIMQNKELSEEFWLPIKTPILDVNMDVQDVQDFFLLKNLPENLRKLFL